MKTILKLLITLSLAINTGIDANSKNYSHKATRPSASDHTWSGYDYDFNMDENGSLSGTNTFSRVYNTTPPKWHNQGYYGEGLRMYTGYETLIITILPGDRNYKYTLTTSVVEWQWDTHQLKWVKRRNMPTNGTRSFTVKGCILSGQFEVPTISSASGVNFVCGNSVDGIIPDNGTLSWKIYNYSDSNPKEGMTIKSEGDSIRINAVTYLEDVKKIDLSGNYHGLGRFGQDKFGVYVKLAFPFIKGLYEDDILGAVASLTGMHKLEKYSLITLPDLYNDNYIDPYEPVTTILDNGHKLVSTLQPNGVSVNTVESWEEDGYSYTKITESSIEKPTIGKKIVDGKTYIHVISINKYDKYEERGFFDKGRYFLTSINTKEYGNPVIYEIDWSPFNSEGYYIISDSEGKMYAVEQKDSIGHTYSYTSVPSYYQNKNFESHIFKTVSNDNITTVSSSNVDALSDQAKEFIRFATHPYIKRNYNYSVGSISMDSEGNVVDGGKMFELSKKPNNPLNEIASLIDMELDIPDYDVEKIDAKVIGKKTTRLLKKLTSFLNQKLNQKAPTKIGADGRPYLDIWPNSVKRAFLKDNRWADFKKAWVSRVLKNGRSMTVWITTVNDKGIEKITAMRLQDNVPVDEYSTVWIHTAKLSK